MKTRLVSSMQSIKNLLPFFYFLNNCMIIILIYMFNIKL